jgi:hypothetical protein
MSDKKPADREILLKHTNEGNNQLSTMQKEFDALLSEEEQQPSITEIDGKLSEKMQQPSTTEIDGKLPTLHASEFAINAPSAAELAKNINATFGDHTIIVVGDHTVIIEEAKSDKIVNMSEDHPSKPKADSKKSTQGMNEASVLQQGKSPAPESNSTVIKPRAFAREISPAEIAAFEAMENRKLKGAAISDTPDNNSEATHAAEVTSPLNDAELFSSMQNDLDTLEHKASEAENFPEWEPIPTEPPAETGSDSMADQTNETTSEETPSPQQPSKFNMPENKTTSAENFPEWEPMPTEPPADISPDSMADQTIEAASEETPSPHQASNFDESENEIARAKNAESKTARYTEPLMVMCRKARALYSKHSVKDIFSKLPKRESMPSEFPTDTSSDSMAEQTSETVSEETPPPRSSKETWGGILFIVFSLAAISLVLWQIVESFVSEVEVAIHTPGNIQSPQSTIQMQAVTAEQPTQIPGKQMSDTGKAGIKPLASAGDNAAEVLKPETAPPAKQAVKPTVAVAIKEEELPVPALLSKPPAVVDKEIIAGKQLESVASAKPAPAVSDTARDGENWAVALSSVDSEKTAIQQQARVRETGLEAEYIRTIKNGKTWFFIQVSGFSNKQEAEKQGGILAKELDTHVSWVNKPKNKP